MDLIMFLIPGLFQLFLMLVGIVIVAFLMSKMKDAYGNVINNVIWIIIIILTIVQVIRTW